MSAAVTQARTTALPRSATAGGRLRSVLQAMMIGLRPMVLGYCLVMVVTFAIGGLITQYFGGGLDHSMWDYGTQSPKYFSAAIGITLTPALFTLLIAHGVTRRMFAVASSILLVGAAASLALLWVVVYQVERGIYDLAGLTQTLGESAPVHQDLAGRADLHRVLPADHFARSRRLVARHRVLPVRLLEGSRVAAPRHLAGGRRGTPAGRAVARPGTGEHRLPPSTAGRRRTGSAWPSAPSACTTATG